MHWKCIFVLATLLATVKINADPGYIDVISFLGTNFKITTYECGKKALVYKSRTLALDGQSIRLLKSENLLEFPISHRHLFIVNLDCKSSAELLEKANKLKLFAFPFHWICYYEERTLESLIENRFANLSVLVDSDFNLAEKRNDEQIIFRKIFKRHRDEPIFNIEDFGMWTQQGGFTKYKNGSNIVRERKNLGVILKASLVITNNNTINHLTDKREKHIDSITKVNYILVLLMASIYNITLSFSISNTWGYKNGSQWTGMMGELVDGKTAIGGTSLFLVRERIDLIDYIAMISPTRSKFVFREPKLSYVTNVYTLPFESKVWISTIALVFVMILTLFLLMKWEFAKNKKIKPDNTSNQIELHGSLSDVAFLTIGAICQQGAAALPYSTPGRIATLFLFISLMFIYVSYSANIVALLQTSSSNIRTLDDLLKSRITVGVDDTVFNHYYFAAADEPIRKALYQKKVAPPGKTPSYMPIEEGVKKMRQGLFAFHMETGAGYKIVGETFREDEKCGLQEIAFLQVVDPWLAIQKNSSYKEMLKIGLRLLQENGIQQRENNLIYTRRPTCTSRSSSFISVGIVDCYPAAAILAGGISASITVFILELYVHYKVQRFR